MSKLKSIKGIRKADVERNLKIIKEIFILNMEQRVIAAKYNLKESRITQIKNKYFPYLKNCMADQLDLGTTGAP